MKHLFIINPVAEGVVNYLSDIRAEIESCFVHYPWLSYDIHVTRWQRDAVGFIRRYCQNEPGLVRIYAVGGNGILYEVVNGAMGLPNVQVACYSREGGHTFIHSLGQNAASPLDSVSDLVFAETRQVDLIRCDANYGLSFSMFGMEAMADIQGKEWFSRYRVISSDTCYFWAVMYNMFRSDTEQNYRILLDDVIALEGNFLGALVANQPCHGRTFRPGTDALPDDGELDLYLWNKAPRVGALKIVNDYMRGQYHAWPEYIQHYRFRKMTIKSDDLIAISMDGELFYQTEAEFEIMPGALDFACPTVAEEAESVRDADSATRTGARNA
ncbi:MAG: hypothetical protein FWH15_04125 [Betaproteobacteria bacterium]|nr:hypothetical protein [Betaproteobacteria bacterium]